MALASSQHKLDRVRPPRVHITYDVEIGDAIEIRALPFQLGVLGDFTGMPVEPLPRLRDRKFVEVNPDNFDEVLERMAPHLAFNVENRLAGTEGAPGLRVDLHFKSLEDFEPANVARQVKPLMELLELRSKLNDLLGKLQGNDRLEELLTDAITNPDKLKKLEYEIRGSDASIAARPVAAEASSVEPQAWGDIPVADSVNLAAGVAPPFDDVAPVHDVEAGAESESVSGEAVSEEALAAPIEAEHLDLDLNQDAQFDAGGAEGPVAPTLEAAAIDADEGKVEDKKKLEDPDGVPVTEDQTE